MDVQYWEKELQSRRSVAHITSQNVINARNTLRRLEQDDRNAQARVAEAEQELRRAQSAQRRR